MISTPARYRYTRAAAGAYLVHRVTGDTAELLGTVVRDGRAWIITSTARGDLPGEPARYATRVDAVDALSAMLRAAAELDALPTDDEPADREARGECPACGEPAPHGPSSCPLGIHPVPTPADRVVRPGDSEPSCASCGYFTGHTSWCPRRHAEQPAEQLTLAATGAEHDASACTDPDCDAVIVADRATPVAELDERQLWLQFMVEDRALGGYDDDPNEPNDDRHRDLLAEIGRRFGADATELTADYAVAVHMSGGDLVRWARTEHAHLLGIATGRIVPEWRRESEYGVEYAHGDCPTCERLADDAEATARATGSVSAQQHSTVVGSLEVHSATVTRARQFVGR